MLILPSIENLLLQPIRVPGGWDIIINLFYELDPDDDLAGRTILNLGKDSITDPWDDVLYDYFDHSCLWWAKRKDNRYQIAVEWSPMGCRDGRFVVTQGQASPIRFTHPPPKTLTKKRDDIEVSYHLDNPVTWSNCAGRVFESRDRQHVVAILNQWLADCSSSWI